MKKWGIYALTFLTYSLIHSVRTCWASLKTMLEGEPFLFQEEFLGILDMLVLFTLAIFLNIFGHIVQKYPCRRILFPMLATIVLNMLCLFGGLMGGLRSKLFYLVFYGSFGIVSCLGWPVCLYTMSQYIDSSHPTAISLWNSVSQFGDAIAFIITIIVIEGFDIKGSYSLLIIAFLIVLVAAADYKWFHEAPRQQPSPQPPAGNVNENNESEVQNEEKGVNFLTVWLVPGVALPVLAFSIIKSINAIIIAWLVIYLGKVGMITESRVLAISWAISIVLGGLFGSLFNKSLSFIKFIACLFVSGFLFFFLDEMHRRPHEIQVLVLIVLTAILVGVPYNQMGTAVPLSLISREDIKKIPGAKGAIISLMESFGQLMCGISVLIVPSIGVLKLHLMGSAYCFLAVILLACEMLRQKLKPLLSKPSETELQQVQEVQDVYQKNLSEVKNGTEI